MEFNEMIGNLKNLIELFAFLYCLAELFGRKLKIGIHATVCIIVDMFLIAGINNFDFPETFQPLCYIVMFLYGLLYYGKSIKVTLVNCFLAAIIVVILQLLMLFPLYLVFLFVIHYGENAINELIVNLGSLVIIILCSHKIKIKRLSDFFIKRNKLIVGVSILILCGSVISCYQMINEGVILSEVYMQMVYFVLIFLFIIYEWQKSKTDAERKKMQLEMNSLYFEAYDQLIMLVRERQHDMKNHINAILSLSYTTENYNELIAKQREYCGYVIEQNEKTKLVLSSANPLIAGFLYSKIREAESYSITIDYQIGIKKAKAEIPEYELIEMAGILLDNAIEALNNVVNADFFKKIFFSIKEIDDSIELIVANTSPHYEEDLTEHFFELGYSNKGQNRGIGLSKLKHLVQNRKGDIMVYNEQRGDMNYLTFEIKLLKVM